MPITDYDFTKTLQATSFNDSGATIDKAQAVELVGNDYTGFDGFENGSSQLDWESSSGLMIDSGRVVYGQNSLQVSSTNEIVSPSSDLSSSITKDGKRIVTGLKIDNQTGNSNDFVRISLGGIITN